MPPQEGDSLGLVQHYRTFIWWRVPRRVGVCFEVLGCPQSPLEIWLPLDPVSLHLCLMGKGGSWPQKSITSISVGFSFYQIFPLIVLKHLVLDIILLIVLDAIKSEESWIMVRMPHLWNCFPRSMARHKLAYSWEDFSSHPLTGPSIYHTDQQIQRTMTTMTTKPAMC